MTTLAGWPAGWGMACLVARVRGRTAVPRRSPATASVGAEATGKSAAGGRDLGLSCAQGAGVGSSDDRRRAEATSASDGSGPSGRARQSSKAGNDPLQREAVRPDRAAGGRRVGGGVWRGGTVGQRRGSSSPDKNPLQRGAVRPDRVAGGRGPSLASASAGQPGRDGDRRTRTRTPYNVRRASSCGGDWGRMAGSRAGHDGENGDGHDRKRGDGHDGKTGDGRLRAAGQCGTGQCGRTLWLAGRGLLGLHLARGGERETRIGGVAQEPLTT
jgi:hypothetical protein